MALLSIASTGTLTLFVAFASLVGISSLLFYLFNRPPFPSNAPKPTTDAWPVLGSLRFFTRRWDFYQQARAQSKTGNFSFYAGQWPVVALSGLEERKVFFENKGLDFSEGYSALLAGAPGVKENNNPLAPDHGGGDGDFGAYFIRRLVALLKGPQLKKGLPRLLNDARQSLDHLAANPSSITNPFDSIYRMVFQFTMRTVACHEIADDAPKLAKCLHLFEEIEHSASPLGIMFPWLPLPSKVKRTYNGAQLYMIFKKVIDDRKKQGINGDDALGFLMEQGDNVTDILTFVLASLFAGQLNSGINAAWILCYLANKPYWWNRVREEVEGVANRYCADSSLSLKDRLMQVPIEAWEGEFPIIDICLKDSIRLQTAGTAFRRNTSGKDITLNKSGEVIPAGAFATLAAGDIHLNPSIYENPEEWDPSRYLPERQEDKKQPYAWMGWGLARHPCLGMRFAKLENNIIVAMFIAYFEEAQVCDAQGNPTDVPRVNHNNHTAKKPDVPVYLKYRARQEAKRE